MWSVEIAPGLLSPESLVQLFPYATDQAVDSGRPNVLDIRGELTPAINVFPKMSISTRKVDTLPASTQTFLSAAYRVVTVLLAGCFAVCTLASPAAIKTGIQ